MRIVSMRATDGALLAVLSTDIKLLSYKAA